MITLRRRPVSPDSKEEIGHPNCTFPGHTELLLTQMKKGNPQSDNKEYGHPNPLQIPDSCSEYEEKQN